MTSARGPYTCTYREIWNDEKFWLRSELGQRVYFYVLSTPLGNGLGCFRAGVAAMAEDMRTTPKRFLEWFREGFDEQYGEPLYLYDERHKVVFIPKYLQRNPPNNPNGIKALGKSYVQVPDCDLKLQCYRMVEAFVSTKGESFVQSFRESFAEPLLEPPGTISPSGSLSGSLALTITNTKARAKPLRDPTAGFDEFYAAYPKQEDLEDARAAWRSTAKKRPELSVILEAIETQKNGAKWRNGYIKTPANWLRSGSWADKVAPYVPEETQRQREEREKREEEEAFHKRMSARLAAAKATTPEVDF